MRLTFLAGPAALALALSACGSRTDPANQLSTEATFNDSEANAALGGIPAEDANAAANVAANTE